MTKFKVIPVIDILNSNAVHAIKGERDKYEPLKSKLFKTSNPFEIIQVLKQDFKFNEYYIADLDAIIKKEPNIKILSKILHQLNVDLMIDPGISNKNSLSIYSKFKLRNLIIGLETIENFDVIKECLKKFSTSKTIVSIDMYNGNTLSKIKSLNKTNPVDVIEKFIHYGVKKFILLDLFRVGRKVGGIPSSFVEIRNSFDGELYVGGGIRSISDILNYKKKKFNGVLIATALYDGSIKIRKVKELINS